MSGFDIGLIDKYVDAADLASLEGFAQNPAVAGFTTNPTLMRRAGVNDYFGFATEASALTNPKPLSLEVFSDTPEEMVKQALSISTIGPNVFVKVPVTTTTGRSLAPEISALSSQGVRLNVTAILSLEQVKIVSDALDPDADAIISVFAGRIADTGVDPQEIMSEAAQIVHRMPGHKLLWASPREILNLIQAQQCGCDIITMTPDLWKKIELLGRDLEALSLDTVQMFRTDAVAAGYRLD
ncbi:transaldolase family protein [Ferrimicrobium sp.]|uniref:transaldolase family protein n=1 Tax=Ferrimicrobium sp. TaxID=2926050 RepID=UPI00261C71C0|nr:transaldolase family protein [Ferrimicrobium sp.]